MASVRFEGLTKRWGDVTAVEKLNIEVEDKEFLVFVGPSGCGKSTSLRMLAGLETPSDGNIYIDDRVVNDVLPKDRNIAMVFQSYALYPHMNVYDNMAFGLKLRKTPKEEIVERVHAAAENLGIIDLLERKPRALSGGQRQRVAVGRAIVRKPSVFLMDEPLSNLDAKLRVEARTMIQRLHRQLETTFIYVTHDQVEAMTMGTRIAVLRDGLLQQISPPQILYDQPDNVFVAGFIGSPSMNFFDAHLESDGGELYVNTASFNFKVPDHLKEAWGKAASTDVILGVRPEDIHDLAFAPPGVIPVEVTVMVDVIERMGNEIVAYLSVGDNEFVARVDPRTTAFAGHEFTVSLNAANMHIFDAQTELAIR